MRPEGTKATLFRDISVEPALRNNGSNTGKPNPATLIKNYTPYVGMSFIPGMQTWFNI